MATTRMRLTLTSLRGRLFALLAGLLLLCSVGAIVMLVEFRQLHVQLEQVTTESMPRLERASRFVDQANETARTMGEMLLQPSAAQRGIAHIHAVRESVLIDVAWLNTHGVSRLSDETIVQTAALRMRYWASQDTLFRLLQPQPEAARAYYLSTVIPLQKSYVQLIEQLLQQERLATKADILAVRTAYERALYWLLALSCIVLLLTCAFGMLLLRGVLSPIEQAVALARNVARGDLDVMAEDGHVAEVQQLNTALGQMVQALREDRQQRQLTEEALRRSEAELRQLVAHAESLQERERLALARELHDGMGQLLTALRLELGAIRMRYAHLDTALAGQINVAKGIIDQMLPVMRGVVAALRPGSLDAGLVSAVEWLIANVMQRAGIACKLLLPTGEPALTPLVETAAFRIVQEALTNVVRHAQASQVTITIAMLDAENLLLEVADNGIGMRHGGHETTAQGFGLLGMRERVRQHSGSVTFSETPGGGMTLRVHLNINAAAGTDGGNLNFPRLEHVKEKRPMRLRIYRDKSDECLDRR